MVNDLCFKHFCLEVDNTARVAIFATFPFIFFLLANAIFAPTLATSPLDLALIIILRRQTNQLCRQPHQTIVSYHFGRLRVAAIDPQNFLLSPLVKIP